MKDPTFEGKGTHMMEQAEEPTPELAQAFRPAEAGTARGEAWQKPEYTIVETALEVTAYSLATR